MCPGECFATRQHQQVLAVLIGILGDAISDELNRNNVLVLFCLCFGFYLDPAGPLVARHHRHFFTMLSSQPSTSRNSNLP